MKTLTHPRSRFHELKRMGDEELGDYIEGLRVQTCPSPSSYQPLLPPLPKNPARSPVPILNSPSLHPQSLNLAGGLAQLPYDQLPAGLPDRVQPQLC